METEAKAKVVATVCGAKFIHTFKNYLLLVNIFKKQFYGCQFELLRKTKYFNYREKKWRKAGFLKPVSYVPST